jgi:rhodanese-related sulfurtransferase/uncharacterized membrane protein
MDETRLPREVSSSTVIDAPPKDVFPLLEDPHAVMKWVSFLRQVQWATGSGIGAKDRCQLQIGGMKVWMGAQVNVYEKNVRIGRRSVEGMEMRSEVRLVPQSSGTRVEWRMAYRPPMGPLGRLMDLLLMRSALQKGMQTSLGSLKSLAESGYTPIPHVGAEELRQALANGTRPFLLDVRDREDFATPQSRIPGSVNIPMAELPSRMQEMAVARDKEIVTICYAGRMAGEAAEFLRGQGFGRARVLLGGLSSWNATAAAA